MPFVPRLIVGSVKEVIATKKRCVSRSLTKHESEGEHPIEKSTQNNVRATFFMSINYNLKQTSIETTDS